MSLLNPAIWRLQAITFDAKGNLYVGTSPDGKVLSRSANGREIRLLRSENEIHLGPAFGPDGTLYVATGDKGQVLAVSPDGKSELLYNSDEAHIRVLAFDPQGNLLAGTEPSGRVLRITRIAGKDTRKDKDKEPGGSGLRDL